MKWGKGFNRNDFDKIFMLKAGVERRISVCELDNFRFRKELRKN